MLELTQPWWEFILRAVFVYSFILISLRLIGKKQFGELAPFDLILLLLLSNAVENSLNAGDESLLAGLISVSTLFIMDYVVGWLTFKNKKVSHIIEGHPEVLIHNGNVNQHLVKREHISKHDLDAALRSEGCASVKQVKFAVLENNGQISIKKKDEKPEEKAKPKTGPDISPA